MDEAAQALSGDLGLWFKDDQTLVANYWRVVCEYETLSLMSDGGTTTDPKKYADEWTKANGMMAAVVPAPTVEREREIEKRRIEWWTITGTEALKNGEWAGEWIPIVYVGGEQANIDGQDRTKGMCTDATDLFKANNYLLSTQIEEVALSPKMPFVGPKGSFETAKSKWNAINREAYAYVEYDIVEGGQAPQRPQQVQVSAEILSLRTQILDGQRSVIGLMGASLGDRGPETAWRAITARQQEGDTAIFHFMDNLVRGVRYGGMVLVDMIPRVYDANRVIRIINPDGEPQMVAIQQMFVDQETGQQRSIDFARGKYDVTVTAGPAFETQRQQNSAMLVDLMGKVPQIGAVAGDIAVKSLMATPDGDKIAQRVKASIDPGLIGEGDTPAMKQLKDQMGQMQEALKQAQQQSDFAMSELAKQKSVLQGKDIENQTKANKLQADVIMANVETEKARLDVAKKELEVLRERTRAQDDTAAVEQQLEKERLLHAVENLIEQAEERFRLVVEGAAPGLTASMNGPMQANAGADMASLVKLIADGNGQLHSAIAALTQATMAPRHSRVMTPDGREFRSISTIQG